MRVIWVSYWLIRPWGDIRHHAQLHWYTTSPTEIGISPWEIYITSSTNPCTVGHGKTTLVILNLIYGTYINEDILLTRNIKDKAPLLCYHCHILEPHMAEDEALNLDIFPNRVYIWCWLHVLECWRWKVTSCPKSNKHQKPLKEKQIYYILGK